MIRIAYIVFKFLPTLLFEYLRLRKTEKNKNSISVGKRFEYSQFLVRKIIRYGRVKVSMTGQENLPKENGYIMFPNHQGLFDVLALIDIHNSPFSIVAKIESSKFPFVKHVISLLDGLYMDRKNLRQSMGIIKQVTKEVKEGRNYVIFPEGTRSKLKNDTIEFKAGAFKSAIDAKCPIVPVSIINSYKVFDEKSLKKVNVEIHYLTPLLFEEYENMSSTEISEKVRNMIQEYNNKHIA